MNMRFKNVRDRHAGFTRRLNVNIAVRAWIKYRCDSFIIVADQIGKLSDTFSLNGFKNERHNPDLTRSLAALQQDRRCSRNSGEHRLPACCFRQPAKKLLNVHLQSFFATLECRRQAADDCRLAACAPQKTHRTWTVIGSRWLII